MTFLSKLGYYTRMASGLYALLRTPPASDPDGMIRRQMENREQHFTKFQTGYPFGPFVGFDRARLLTTRADLGQRPDFIGKPGDRIILGDPAQYFNPLAFGLPEAGFYGNLGRGTLAGPGLFTLDAALHKALWQTERHSLRLRLEAFNATNHPNFKTPSGLALFDSSLARLGTAGRITETSTTARQVQLAVKWIF